MDKSNFSKESEIIHNAEIFARENIAPFAVEFEEKEAIPKDLIEKMAQKGYLAASFPEEFGGLQLSQVNYGLFTEQIGKACPSVRGLLTVHTSLVGETILRWGTDSQKKKWFLAMAEGRKIGCFALTEPEIGTDAKSIRTTWEKKRNKYIINGRKKWITMSGIADFFLVIATGVDGISAFIVEKNENVKLTPIKGLLAGKAAHICEIEFQNVEVPLENILGKEGNGFSYIVNTALDNGRYSIAWGGLAIAQASMEAMVSYSRKREQFGQKIYKFQLIQGMIGDAVTKIHAARALCLNAGKMRDEKNTEATMETTISKYFTSKIAMEIAIDAVQVHGGNGCYNQYPVERYFREAKILEIIEGTSQIQQEIIAIFGLRKYFKKDPAKSG